MMGWDGYNYGNMMNGNLSVGFGVLGLLFWIVGFVDLVLIGLWLWKQLKKK